MKKILLVGLSLLMACPTFAKIKLPALVGSNMVLQREREVNLWGEASPSKKVTVTTSWDGRKYATQSDSDGKWLLKVSTPAAGGPYTIRISDGDPVTLENVMIGEVWVCSGQSNMQMSMTGNLGEPVDGGVEALIEAPKYKDIRLFYTPMVTSPQPVDTCGGEWKVSSSESVAPFSAAAYFFARDLNDALGVPVGLIQTAWGGTRIEAWMPEATAREVEADIVQTNDRFENPIKVGYLYNAMIRPLLNMTARGFIWYQGESNVHTNNYPHYAHYMEKLVSQWRGDWGDPDMPFYFVQLVPHIYEGGTDGIVLPLMIEQQLAAADRIPNCAMIGTSDMANAGTIHPSEKDQIGRRLALLALTKTYGLKGLIAESPRFESVRFEGGKAILQFKTEGTLGPNYKGRIKGFEIAVRDAQPMAIMTSYNMINGIHAANHYDLCTKAARDEWGFAGAIMTDWTTTNATPRGECTAAGCMRAGNDMVMPGMEMDFESIRTALADGTLDIMDLKRCIWNTIRIILQSGRYEEAVSYSRQFSGLGTYMTAE